MSLYIKIVWKFWWIFKLKLFTTGTSQTCKYDLDFIEEYIKGADKKINISLLHTQPNPLDKQQTTLYNKYTETLSRLGVEPNGLNISNYIVLNIKYKLLSGYKQYVFTNQSITMQYLLEGVIKKFTFEL